MADRGDAGPGRMGVLEQAAAAAAMRLVIMADTGYGDNALFCQKPTSPSLLATGGNHSLAVDSASVAGSRSTARSRHHAV
jgi:hypothetical protein